jgi:hypothetical protein
LDKELIREFNSFQTALIRSDKSLYKARGDVVKLFKFFDKEGDVGSKTTYRLFGLLRLFGFVNHLSFGWNRVDTHDWKLIPPCGAGSAAFAEKLRQAREPSAGTSLVCLVSLVPVK